MSTKFTKSGCEAQGHFVSCAPSNPGIFRHFVEGFMTRLSLLGVVLLSGLLVSCSGGAAGDPSDDIGDIIVVSTSPANGDQLDLEDSDNGWNALNRDDIVTKDAVTIVFSNSLDESSVINPDPTDPQQTRNVRMFYFDESQGPFDEKQPVVPGVNPPGANVLINADAFITQVGNTPDNALVIKPTGFSATNPMPEGQYSVIVTLGVRGADGDGMKGQEYYFYFRVGTDTLGPTVVKTFPANNQQDISPETEIRISLSETILASTVTTQAVTVDYTPTGATVPTPIPGTWYTDGGNGPGNNFPNLQLDNEGNPGRSGVSSRNGVDLVFRPELEGFPVNFAAFDPFDFDCPLTDPPLKGNQGYPRGQAITVTFVPQGSGVTDTAGNRVPIGSPNTTFTFFTEPLPDPVYAPNTNAAIFFGDTFGVGVIDIDSSRTPYIPGPVPARAPDSVVKLGSTTDPQAQVVRVDVPDLVDMTTDTRPYTSMYTVGCAPHPSPVATIYQANLYAASGTQGGGEIVVVDTYRMVPMGRFGTASPGGVAMTANGTADGSGRLAVSNFSANTVTVFDVSKVMWFVDQQGALPTTTSGLAFNVTNGQAKLILDEGDFEEAFPLQRANLTSAPGPSVLGTINAGIGPKAVNITGLPSSFGIYAPPFCFSPIFFQNTIVANANAGESTVDFTELTNLSPNQSIDPDLRGVNTSSQPTDMTWAPPSLSAPPNIYFFIAGVGGTIELFSTGSLGGEPSVRPDSSGNFTPNKIINTVGGLQQPTGMQWITSGLGAAINVSGYGGTVLVAETGENRIQQIGIVAEFPNQFQQLNQNHASGLGPIDIAGDPASAGAGGTQFVQACTPFFTKYYSANAGAGSVTSADYRGAVLGSTIPVPGVLKIASWWAR
jgi:hypothetical protein